MKLTQIQVLSLKSKFHVRKRSQILSTPRDIPKWMNTLAPDESGVEEGVDYWTF
jgi:hypothetical protein